MIDNLKVITDNLIPKDGEFYQITIMQRNKDFKEGHTAMLVPSSSSRVIKTYDYKDVESLAKQYNEIKLLCEVFGARAYIKVDPTSYMDVSLKMMSMLAERIYNKQYENRYIFSKAVDHTKKGGSVFILDIDDMDTDIDAVERFVNGLRPDNVGNKILFKVPTRNGIHIITKKFDVKTFNEKYPKIGIHKNNGTLLYFPESLT